MWSSSRAAAVAACGRWRWRRCRLLAACTGFAPVYGPSSIDSPADRASPTRRPTSRLEQMIYEDLTLRLGTADRRRAEAQRHRLDARAHALTEHAITLGRLPAAGHRHRRASG